MLTERTGRITIGGVRIAYSKGVFDISPPGVFITPFGTRGRHGFVVIEVDDDGKDIPGSGSAFGEAVLRRANAAYDTITGLPDQDGRRRPDASRGCGAFWRGLLTSRPDGFGKSELYYLAVLAAIANGQAIPDPVALARQCSAGCGRVPGGMSDPGGTLRPVVGSGCFRGRYLLVP